MTDVNLLPYYPRFIFNCNDGMCLSTGDVELLDQLKEAGNGYPISRFVSGQRVRICWKTEIGGQDVRTYVVNKIEIHQIKRDLDEPTYGTNSNDCIVNSGRDKNWLMEIYVFLDAVYN